MKLHNVKLKRSRSCPQRKLRAVPRKKSVWLLRKLPSVKQSSVSERLKKLVMLQMLANVQKLRPDRQNSVLPVKQNVWQKKHAAQHRWTPMPIRLRAAFSWQLRLSGFVRLLSVPLCQHVR